MLLGLLTHLALLAPARAQDTSGFDAHGFVLAAMDGDPRDPLYVSRPGRFEQGDFFFGGLFEYAKSPLTRVTLDSAGDVVRSDAVLDDIFALNLSAGGAVFDRLRIDVAAPLYFASSGSGGDPQGFGLGDIRASAMVAVLRPSEDGGFGLGVVPYIDLPTGDSAAFLGQGKVAGGGKVTATAELGRVTVGGEVGVQFNPAITLDNLTNSDVLTTGLALGYAPTDTLGVNLEAHLASPFQASSTKGSAAPAEGILSVRSRSESGGFIVGGVAAGLSQGASAALFRVFLGGGFGKIGEPAPLDTDGDGLTDDIDACPTEPETVNAFHDEDGCPDALPNVTVAVTLKGTALEGVDFRVLAPAADPPVQAEGKTSVASPWSSPSLPGIEWTARSSQGDCLAGEAKGTVGEEDLALVVALEPKQLATVVWTVVDTDDKPIPGAIVTWEKDDEGCVATEPMTLGDDGTGRQPAGKGSYRAFARAPGYATKDVMVEVPQAGEVPVKVVLPTTKVKVEQKAIAILDKVYFETDSDVIKAESFDLLNEVAATIMANPQVGRVEVQGHTDSVGSDAHNLDLSDRRAKSVRAYLVQRGVPEARLLAKGYGETMPLAPNTTTSGKAKNRRVEFKLIDAPTDSAVQEAPK